MEALMGLLPFVAMFAIMWFFLIRPAQKRQKDDKSDAEPAETWGQSNYNRWNSRND